jgi:hypothetical protein
MPSVDIWGDVAPHGVIPDTSLSSSDERAVLRQRLALNLPSLERLLESARRAADGPHPETALVYVWMLRRRAEATLTP